MTDHDGLYVENMGGPHAYRHLHHLIRKPCPHCGKQITEQNLSAHVRRMHPEGETR